MFAWVFGLRSLVKVGMNDVKESELCGERKFESLVGRHLYVCIHTCLYVCVYVVANCIL